MKDLTVRRLPEPPPSGFDCGRDAQNAFLYDRAWADQGRRLSTTYIYYALGVFAAYATVCMDAVQLGTREKEPGITYKSIGAVKLAQLGVHHGFQGLGIGAHVLADVIILAQGVGRRVGGRYLSVDAAPDVVEWYRRMAFVENRTMQKHREEAAAKRGGGDNIAVSMRFDLREV